MAPQFPEDDISALEKARERLYKPEAEKPAPPPATPARYSFPHAWKDALLPATLEGGKRHVRLATIFFGVAVLFFIIALGIAAFFFSVGGNTVSVDKIQIDVQGPTAVSGGDTVPLSLTVTNRNPVAVQDAVLEIDFPNGTRDPENLQLPYPHYIEKIGTLESGASVTRSIKAAMFGAAGEVVTIPISFTYGAPRSNAVFAKKSSYALTITTTPLEVSVDTLTETVSNKPLTLTMTVRSNATIPLQNVVLSGSFPFGFVPTSSSIPLNNSVFYIGTLAPGATKTVTLTGTLTGQNNEQRIFRFAVGTANSANNPAIAVSYMTQDAAVTIAAPFIDTSLSINGKSEGNVVLTPGSFQNVSLSYANTLSTSVENATVEVAISGSAVDYDSIRTSSGFYNSSDHTIVFSKDTDPALASLAPGATGFGAFSFSTVPSGSSSASPNVTFTISVSGTRVGQTNVPEEVSATMTKTAKVMTTVALTAASLRNAGGFSNTGPIPPRADQESTYTVQWTAQNRGSAIGGGAVSATLPSYVSYTGRTGGSGSVSYNESSRTVTWNIGDIAQNVTAQAVFQVTLKPSTSQRGSAPALTSAATFSGFDRFAGVQVSVSADPVTTETKTDSGYTSANATVQ